MAPAASAASPQECGAPRDHGETPAVGAAAFERPRAGVAGARLAARVGPAQAPVLHSGKKAVSSARTLGRRRVEKGQTSLTLRQKSRDLPRLAFSPWRKDPADSAHAGGACALHLSRLCKIGSARWLASQSTAETVAPGCRKSAGLLAARRALQQPTRRDQLPWAFHRICPGRCHSASVRRVCPLDADAPVNGCFIDSPSLSLVKH